MNLSATSTSGTISYECEPYELLRGSPDYTTTGVYALLIFIIVVNIITCPFTIILNALVMIAVKTKARLKTKSNTTLACLALTDVLVGIIAQPLFAGVTMSISQGETSNKYYPRQRIVRAVLRSLAGASIRHLVLISVERYLAIKHPFTYTTMVTKARILCSSGLAWITVVAANLPLLLTNNNTILTLTNILLFICMTTIVFCQITVYIETRRHEKEIAAQQVSQEARQKFLKEKKALKLTTTVLFILFLCYSPQLVVRILFVSSKITTVNSKCIVLFSATTIGVLNSFINPIVYCVRTRQFRSAFIEILRRKNYTQAEQFERRIFRMRSIVVALEAPKEIDHQTNSHKNPNNNNNDTSQNSIIYGIDSNIIKSSNSDDGKENSGIVNFTA